VLPVRLFDGPGRHGTWSSSLATRGGFSNSTSTPAALAFVHPSTLAFGSSKSKKASTTTRSLASRIVSVQAAAAATAAVTSAGVAVSDQLTYLQTMVAGAISRTMAQTLMHPANTYKTVLQLPASKGRKVNLTPERLLRGADAQFLMSLPHGAFHFFVIDQVKEFIGAYLPNRFLFLADFTASAISTVVCSVVSTPQMVLTDRLMAGIYPSFPAAVKSIMASDGIMGFYAGWWPALAQKIPSYGLTWMFFQQLKRAHEHYLEKQPSTEMNFGLGAIAAAASVAVMIPMDTVKTRLVIQVGHQVKPYLGVTDCFMRIMKEEGIGAFYRSLPPRLMSVVPMIAIQFGVYEAIKANLVVENRKNNRLRAQAALQKVKTTGAKVASSIKSKRAKPALAYIHHHHQKQHHHSAVQTTTTTTKGRQ